MMIKAYNHHLFTLITASILLFVIPEQGFPGQTDLQDLSFEELTVVGLSNAPRTVTASTAAKVTQTTAQAPSVMRIVTAEDIQTYGYRTLAEILRSLPGLYTTFDGLSTYLGVRGLGRPGDYNTRVLILIDGIRINDNIFDSALVGREFPLDVSLIDRVEYAPGPGSAVYGKNAFFGVVNVITKRGYQYDGTEVSAGMGSFNMRKAHVNFGKRFDGGQEMLFGLAGFQNADVSPSLYEEFDRFDSDFDKNLTALGKLSIGSFQAEMIYGRRNCGLHVSPYALLLDTYDEFTDEKFFLGSRYLKRLTEGWTIELRGTYGLRKMTGVLPFQDYGERIEDIEYDAGSWLSGEFRVINTRLKNHRILFGIEGYRDLTMTSKLYIRGETPYFYMEDLYSAFGVYIQDDLLLTDTLTLLLGARHDSADLGKRTNPRIGLIWQPNDKNTIKLLYGSAFRTANFFEASANQDAALYTENRDVPIPDIETIETAEIALDHYLRPSFILTGSLYHYRIHGIIEEYYDEEEGIIYLWNGRPIDALGVEFAAQKRFPGGAVADVSYTVQETEDSDGNRLSNSPAHQVKLHASIPLWASKGRLGVEVLYIGPRTTEESTEIDDYCLTNLALTYPLSGHIDLNLGVYNLGNARYYDPALAITSTENGVRQEERSVDCRIDFRF